MNATKHINFMIFKNLFILNYDNTYKEMSWGINVEYSNNKMGERY